MHFWRTNHTICALLATVLTVSGGAPASPDFSKSIEPLLERYCYSCHGAKRKGDLDLRLYPDAAAAKRAPEVFAKVLKYLEAHEMPPENRPQPTPAERELLTKWIDETILGCDCNHPDPGRVTIRRLNRAEYNNTIRDLMGVKFKPAEDFPDDEVGYGFDNIGDVLSLSPLLLEKYLAAAEKILDAAIVIGPSTNGGVQHFEAATLEGAAPGGPYRKTMRTLTREGEITTRFKATKAGEYILRARAFGQQAGPEPARMAFLVDHARVKAFDVKAVENRPGIYEARLSLTAGTKQFAASYLNNYVRPDDPDPNNRDRNLIIDYLEVIGPIAPVMLPESHKRIFVRQPTPATKREAARDIIARFATRAYRRPVTTNETSRVLKFFDSADAAGEDFETSIKLALQAVLVSPHFLFRGEFQPQPDNAKVAFPVDEFALASRLSYFLWSSMPDDELFELAGRGQLRKNLDAQVRRMLRDPKAEALAKDFAGQWLQIRNLESVAPDPATFPDFNDSLRSAMASETELFFNEIVRSDRSVLDFLRADYSFLNEQLAKHYGIPRVKGEEFRRVSLRGTKRGGILTQASFLTVTSSPTRTSPVKRGKWVLDNILGTPPPPPPANVPPLPEGHDAPANVTLRERMERHRMDPTCASCHARMDPIGFGFENYDALGRWREQDAGKPIDASGKLVTGESFNGAADLEKLLQTKLKDQFVRCLAGKLLTYGLGRGLEHYDRCAVDEITKAAGAGGNRFSSFVLAVVKSTPFQMRRGEGDRFEGDQ